MKTGLAHTLIALLVTGTVAAGYGNAPTTPGPRQADPAGTTPLSVELECYMYSGNRYYCLAISDGGSYEYSFTWVGAYKWGEDYFDRSWAGGMCDGSEFWGLHYVEVTVTDSNAATASAYEYLNCPNPF